MGVCANERVSQAELDTVLDLCSGFSKAEMIDEKLMDVVTAVSGSSPAYVFMFIEAMADAAVAGGMQGARHIHLQPRQCLEVQKWFSRQESIRASSRIWCAHRPEQLSRLCVCLRKRA